MASERDREIWDDATNAVCQAMQEQKMCNCPDGDCLAAKIDFSPEKIATATRPAPAATDTGLETVEHQYWRDQTQEWLPTGFPDRYRKDGFQVRELVTRSQAEELLAAERAEKERLRGLLTSATYDLARANDECGALTIDNAAKDARVEELIGTNIAVARRQEELANQLAETKGLLKTADDLAWQRGAAIEALEAKLASKDGWKELHDAAQVAVKERTEACNSLYKQVATLEAKLAAAEKALETKSAANEALSKAVVESIDTEKRLRDALTEIASFTQTTDLLWWQERARAALGGKP